MATMKSAPAMKKAPAMKSSPKPTGALKQKAQTRTMGGNVNTTYQKNSSAQYLSKANSNPF